MQDPFGRININVNSDETRPQFGQYCTCWWCQDIHRCSDDEWDSRINAMTSWRGNPLLHHWPFVRSFEFGLSYFQNMRAWQLQRKTTADLLTHWGRVTHICVSKFTIIGSDTGLSPSRRQAIFWTNAGILLIGPLGTNFNEISIEIHKFSFKKIHLNMSSGKWRPSCLGLNVLMVTVRILAMNYWIINVQTPYNKNEWLAVRNDI